MEQLATSSVESSTHHSAFFISVVSDFQICPPPQLSELLGLTSSGKWSSFQPLVHYIYPSVVFLVQMPEPISPEDLEAGPNSSPLPGFLISRSGLSILNTWLCLLIGRTQVLIFLTNWLVLGWKIMTGHSLAGKPTQMHLGISCTSCPRWHNQGPTLVHAWLDNQILGLDPHKPWEVKLIYLFLIWFSEPVPQQQHLEVGVSHHWLIRPLLSW